jgi:parvulin-like peptidyl-prolyl isomerase
MQAIQMYSDDKSTLRTNGEQIIIRGTLPNDLDEKIFEARLGEVLGPIMQQEGIYILRVNEKRAANTLTYEQLRRDIINYLISVALQQKIQQQVKDLVQQAKVQILVPEYKVNSPRTTSN